MREMSLDEVKKVEIDILDYISELCDQNGLRYYLMAGTLIGAVRHKGFIPWDDDIDIGMPRPDYNKLKEILKDDLHENRFKLLTYEYGNTDYNFMKVVDDRTILYEKYINTPTGVWVDVFPIDGLPTNSTIARLLCYKLEFWRRLLSIHNAKLDIATSKKRLLIKRLIAPVAKIFSVGFLCKKVNNVFEKYDYDKCIYVGAVSGGFSYKARIEKDVYEQSFVEFEGKKYAAPAGSDRLLSKLYGDYMQIPPVEKQIQHEFRAFWKD